MRITIIGAGYTGTTLATELATSFDTDLDVLLVGVLARGHCWELTAVGELRSAVYALSHRLQDRRPDHVPERSAAHEAYSAAC